MIISGRAILAYLAALAVFSTAGFFAGYAWKGRECGHLITVQEITEIQGGMLEDIETLRNGQERIQRCCNSLANRIHGRK